MKARDVMISDVYVAHKDDTVEDVLHKFATHRIGGMPIIDLNNKVIGYISDGDIMRFLGKRTGYTQTFLSLTADYVFYVEPDEGQQRDLDDFRRNFQDVRKQSVLDVGIKRAVCVTDDEEIQEVARILGQKKFKKVPVVRNDRLVGIISRGDVIRMAVQRFLSES